MVASPCHFVLPLILLAAAIPCTSQAAQRQTLKVWPGTAPGEKGDVGEEHLMPAKKEARPVQRLTNVSQPTLTIYPADPAKNTGTAIVICPGGGYSILAMDLEGEEVATWLNSIGVTGIILKYRVPARKDQPKHLAPLQDAQRAVSLVRSHAADWKIAPDRIGILGFSAGGHLAASTTTNADQRQYAALDEVDKTSCRPDFAVLLYPAYLVQKDGTLAPEIRVDAHTPPLFFTHCGDDRISSENSALMYLAAKRAGVSAELHVYATGGHGFGLRPSPNACSMWPDRCRDWLQSRGLLGKTSAKPQ